MATLKIEPGTNGRVWVSFTRFSDAEIARLKQIPGKQWNPERKQWSLPDTPETRKVLAEIVAMPPSPPPKMIAVKPKSPHPVPPPFTKTVNRGGEKIQSAEARRLGKHVPGRDKPLTTDGTSLTRREAPPSGCAIATASVHQAGR